jgi:opacity protein-like surface antigen
MTKILLAAIATTVVTAASAPAMAQPNGFYAGATYSSVKLDEDEFGLSADLNGLGVLGGYRFNQYFAFEGRAVRGVGNDTILGVNTKLDSYVGANAVVNVPLAEGFSLYGTLGYGRVSIKFSDSTESIKGSENSASYGGGLQYNSGKLTFRGGYESLFNKDTVSAAGLTLTGMYSF